MKYFQRTFHDRIYIVIKIMQAWTYLWGGTAIHKDTRSHSSTFYQVKEEKIGLRPAQENIDMSLKSILKIIWHLSFKFTSIKLLQKAEQAINKFFSHVQLLTSCVSTINLSILPNVHFNCLNSTQLLSNWC